MAGPDGTPAHDLDLTRLLKEEPYKFGFFQALRLLECIHDSLPRVGKSRRPAEDFVRLAQEPLMTFANATLTAYQDRADGKPAKLTSAFFGLFGPQGALPLHLTEFARDRLRNQRDPTLVRFLDLFHHRMLQFFYRAWANAEPTVNFDRPQDDRFGDYVASLIGLGIPSLRDRDAMPDLAKLHYSGHFACQTRNAENLETMLEDFFKIPVCIREFVGEWLTLPEGGRWLLGRSRQTGGLGTSAILGARVWQCQQKFRIEFGPVNLHDYRRMLPGRDSLARLVAAVRNYVGDELNWDVNLILLKEDVPPLHLGTDCELGWTTWANERHEDYHANDLILNPLADVL